MKEVAVVIGEVGQPLFWHNPGNAGSAALPDSRSLWDAIWNNRHNIFGVAHSHPGTGIPAPSFTDLTTFAAVESALGKRIFWVIITTDQVAVFFFSQGKYEQIPVNGPFKAITRKWLDKLRQLSYGENVKGGVCDGFRH